MTQLQIKLKTAKIKKRDIAEQLGVSKTTVNNWIQGKGKGPSYETIPKLAEILGCEILELFESNENFLDILDSEIKKSFKKQDYYRIAKKFIETYK